MLPNIIVYLSSGFIFLKVYVLTATRKEPSSFEHITIQSLIVGFVLYSLASVAPHAKFEEPVVIAIYLLCCAVCGYLFGKLISSEKVSALLRKLGVTGSVSDSLWQEIDDPGHDVWVHLINRKQGYEYFGVLCLYEVFERKPIIMLNRYEITRIGEQAPIKDYDIDPTRRILLDTSQADEIRFIYDSDSTKSKRTTQAIRKAYPERLDEITALSSE